MTSSQQLVSHTNEENQCAQRLPCPEGVDQSKMDQILGRWGATWEGIYEIIFPGARVPDPCKCLTQILSGSADHRKIGQLKLLALSLLARHQTNPKNSRVSKLTIAEYYRN